MSIGLEAMKAGLFTLIQYELRPRAIKTKHPFEQKSVPVLVSTGTYYHHFPRLSTQQHCILLKRPAAESLEFRNDKITGHIASRGHPATRG